MGLASAVPVVNPLSGCCLYQPPHRTRVPRHFTWDPHCSLTMPSHLFMHRRHTGDPALVRMWILLLGPNLILAAIIRAWQHLAFWFDIYFLYCRHFLLYKKQLTKICSISCCANRFVEMSGCSSAVCGLSCHHPASLSLSRSLSLKQQQWLGPQNQIKLQGFPI